MSAAGHKPYTSADLYSALLRDVSRSFYLTLRVLPGGVRRQIGLAYLLARAADTIADTEIVPAAERLRTLEALRNRVLGAAPGPLDLHQLLPGQSLPAEQALLERIEEAIVCLDSFGSDDRLLIRTVLEIIISGQALDLQRFELGSLTRIRALTSAAELDDYTYRVAGCVGEFWTRLCRAHLFPAARLDVAEMLERGICFGKGLQLVNILRDLPRDLQRNRCYLPADQLAGVGLQPRDLTDPACEPQLRPVYNQWLSQAEAHLEAGWNYTTSLPRYCVRVRLACAWPVLIGIKTCTRLRRENVLNPARRIKVSRREVKTIMAQTVWYYPFERKWRGLFRKSGW